MVHCVSPSAQPTIPEQLGALSTHSGSSLPGAIHHLTEETENRSDTGKLTADQLITLVRFLYQQQSVADRKKIVADGIIAAHTTIGK